MANPNRFALKLRIGIGVVLAIGTVGIGRTSTFFPESASPLTAAEIAALPVVGGDEAGPDDDEIRVDDMIFMRQSLLVAGFSAKPWPGGRLIYDASTLSATQRARFLAACQEWSGASKVRCVARTNQAGGYIRILKVSGNTSSSFVGYPGATNVRRMKLCCFGTTAAAKKHLAHEIGHALGLSHEHMRSDRDTYVRILWQNIISGYEDQFEKRQTANFGAYDFRSAMHYRGNARGRQGRTTIRVLPPNQAMQNVIGRVTNLSTLDKSGMAARYKTVP